MKLSKYLRELAKDEPGVERDDEFGICVHIESCFGSNSYEAQCMMELFELWPEYSGDAAYPIKSPIESKNSRAAFRDCINKYDGKYGKARKRCCIWLARQLEAVGE